MGKTAKPAEKHKRGSMSDQMRAFATQYCVDFNGYKAAVRAGYAEKSARVTASKLLARDDVQELIQQKMARVEAKTEITAEKVLQEAFGIATADVNELVEFRRRCCRHCYGIDHGYQRTVQEMSYDREKYERERRAAEAGKKFNPLTYPDFDEAGGVGYDARREPHPNCTHCWGDGVGDAFFKPTSKLSPEARALYAGVKQTKDGFQMLLVDKNAALEKLFKHLGLYKEDNKQKGDGALSALVAFMQTRGGGKLPIKPESGGKAND